MKFYISNVTNHDGIDLIIEKDDVLQLNIQETIAQLLLMINSHRALMANQNRLRIHFDGYNDDPREVFEIAEIRRFARRLIDEFPYLFWLADLDSPTLAVLFHCYGCGTEVRRHDAGKVGGVFASPDIKYFMRLNYQGVARISADHGISVQTRDERNRHVQEYFEERHVSTETRFAGSSNWHEAEKDVSHYPFAQYLDLPHTDQMGEQQQSLEPEENVVLRNDSSDRNPQMGIWQSIKNRLFK